MSITTVEITKSFDFESLKKGDYLACEFYRDLHDYPKKYRFKVFQIVRVRTDTKEIILQEKNNLFFNYEMFSIGQSNLKSAILINYNNTSE